MIDIRLPHITGTNDGERLKQVESYLYQFAEQLQWALQNVDTNNNASVVMPAARSLAPSGGNASGEINAPATFASIKSLIIKSADIVNAYSEELKRHYEGYYVAQSDFGTYVEKTQSVIEENSTGIKQTYAKIQAIYEPKFEAADKALTDASTELDDKITELDKKTADAVAYVSTTKGYIKTGIVEIKTDESGVEHPVYGVEVGQENENGDATTFKAFARFTADKLSFFDSYGDEVAYVSNKKLYITEAEIKGNLTLGGYLIDTSNGLAFKWAGGN